MGSGCPCKLTLSLEICFGAMRFLSCGCRRMIYNTLRHGSELIYQAGRKLIIRHACDCFFYCFFFVVTNYSGSWSRDRHIYHSTTCIYASPYGYCPSVLLTGSSYMYADGRSAQNQNQNWVTETWSRDQHFSSSTPMTG